jgi:hypothetical protein
VKDDEKSYTQLVVETDDECIVLLFDTPQIKENLNELVHLEDGVISYLVKY